ncbi:NACHT domain-containing protein [Amycolatopsis cihanbeyliensis]|uniref:Sulfatase-modifying factor enzyme 1 n=1 Tax=Amycolatopsis cihanbeyliensis TaxID=1128664 RepID=A0A542DQE2_AMYCI|nr:NACHT domain-containing protein [Amycolatopsis cihanbeyliensis]TQJ05323.1 sulfatase-modifying factor enzyme 1 [Amycolatopsis cihanbeyliensis]
MLSRRGKVGLLAAAIVLPVVAVGVWWRPIVSHPVVTGTLLAGYGLVLTIARELWKRWQVRIVDWIEQTVGRLASRFEQHYREFVLNSLRFVDLKGLTTIGFCTPELDDVFVDMGLARHAASKAEEGVLGRLPEHVTERLSLRRLIDRSDTQIFAVVGVPGSGKTTLLRHTARQVCQRPGQRTVPIVLYLRDHVRTIVGRPDVTLVELLRSTLGRYASAEPPGWFEQRLQDGRCVVLLDGLDEIGLPADRRQVADWIEHQTTQYPQNAYVVTSRPRGYREAPITGAQVLQVRSFSYAQVAEFVHGWYLAVEKHAAGVVDEGARLRAQSAADDLLERLNGAPELYDLTVNPLLLTMIANVHRDRGALPGSRAGLYSEICQVMLWRRQEAKKLDSTLSGPKKEVLLRGLAFRMMRRHVRDLPREDVYEEFESTLLRMPEQVTAADLLADVRHHGLLIERENGLYSFAHQTLQEYLAAAHIQDKGIAGVLEQAVDDNWWRETTVLYAAMSDTDPIVRACLESGSVTALSLAFDCADGGRELAPELRRHLEELLTSALTPQADPELRRLMIRVVITNHTRHVTRTGDGRRVCSRPVTDRIYRLYRQETAGDAFPGNDAEDEGRNEDEPVVGVRRRDAAAFARWINDITDGEPGYHLPTRTELDDPAVRRALPTCSVWITPESGNGVSALWSPADSVHPHAVDVPTLTQHLGTDIERSMPQLLRLLLLSSIVTVRCLEHARTITHTIHTEYLQQWERAFDHVDHDHGALRNLARDVEAAHEHMLGIAKDLSRTIETVRALDPAVPLDHKRVRALVSDLNNERTLNEYEYKLAEESEDSLVRLLEHAVEAIGNDHPLGRVVDVSQARALDLAADTDYVRALQHTLGSALAQSLSRVLDDGARRDWPARLGRELVAATSVPETEFVVYPDTLAERLRSGCAAVRGRLPGSWAAAVAGTLEETAGPMVSRPWERPLTEEAAAAIRLAAFCLAAEADAGNIDHLRATFLEIAAGVTFLQRRATDDGLITQTIVLAIA